MSDLLDLVDKGGVIVILLIALVGGLKGWWTFGPEHKRATEDLRACRADVKEFQEKQLELIRQMAPLLSDATRALGEVQEGMEAAIRRRPTEADRVLRRLEAVVREIDERGQR